MDHFTLQIRRNRGLRAAKRSCRSLERLPTLGSLARDCISQCLPIAYLGGYSSSRDEPSLALTQASTATQFCHSLNLRRKLPSERTLALRTHLRTRFSSLSRPAWTRSSWWKRKYASWGVPVWVERGVKTVGWLVAMFCLLAVEAVVLVVMDRWMEVVVAVVLGWLEGIGAVPGV